MTRGIRLFRCDRHSAWITVKQCEANAEQEKQSKLKLVIEGMATCRDCPGILELPDLETKLVERRTRAGKKKRGKGPSPRSQLHQTMKKRLEKQHKAEADTSE